MNPELVNLICYETRKRYPEPSKWKKKSWNKFSKNYESPYRSLKYTKNKERMR